jgi:hypothetical protein
MPSPKKDTMNLTALIAHALATTQALRTGRTTDPLIIRLVDEIFQISGADACAFGACGVDYRNLFFDPDVVDYVMHAVPEQWGADYDAFYNGRQFVMTFNDSLPDVLTVLQACARAERPTVLARAGDSSFCTLGKRDLPVPNASIDELLVHYHRTEKYNACLSNQTIVYEYKPRMCLMKAFNLNEPALYNAARAAQTVRQMLVRRNEFLLKDIVAERDKANMYLYEHGKSDLSGSGKAGRT